MNKTMFVGLNIDQGTVFLAENDIYFFLGRIEERFEIINMTFS